jgi:alkanesulfonate monooxygenase SsuD/methylene tetrahydromethanopterin reductase-like flavin-dependent oxidoreductase (luciferase family)
LATTEHSGNTPRRPLRIGIELDIEALSLPEPTPLRWNAQKEMARLAEDAGFDSLWLPDHMFGVWDGKTVGAWECWSMLAAVAAVTERVALGTLVLATSFREPALLAKMADTVDEISGGRLILGLGAGWFEAEYRAFGFPYDHRASRFEEAFTIIRTLLREGKIDFDGTYYQARDCELLPRGPRPHGMPFMIGTRGPRMMRLTAQHAEMWNAWVVSKSNTPSEALAKLNADLDAACHDVGRDPATLARSAAVMVHPYPTPPPPLPSGCDAIWGDHEAIAEKLLAYVDEGISHLQVVLAPATPKSLEAFAPVLEVIDRTGR